MKLFILAAAMLSALTPSIASAQHSQVRVDGYTRSDGTRVQPHYRTTPNQTRNDNWTTRGNTNPHTGVEGTRPRDYNSPYSQPYRPYRPR